VRIDSTGWAAYNGRMRTLARIFLAALLAISLAGCTHTGDGGSTPPATTAHWVTGYYVAYAPLRTWCTPDEIDWSGLTHIAMGRIKANSNGTLARDFDWDSTNGPALARTIAQRAHSAGKKAILMLGGAGQGWAIHSAMASQRAAFVANLVQAMNEYGYDGLDLDWEDDVDWDLFLGLATDLRRAAPKAVLTMPLGMINPNYQSVEGPIAAIAAQLDQLNLMAYYPATCMAGAGWLSWHNCPLDGWKAATPVTISDTLARYVQAGVPKAKLGMGIAFYAIGYNGGITAPNQATESGVAIVGGDNDLPLCDFYKPGGLYNAAARQWDALAREPYLSLDAPDGTFGCRYFSYEDEASIAAKGAFAKANGYGGIIVWNLNQGYVRGAANPTFLTQALKKAFID
jgi:chitinase